MPETIRATGGRRGAHPRRSGFRFAAAIAADRAVAHRRAGRRRRACRTSTPTSTRFAALDRDEIAALALTLGVLLFAVVTAIMLVRTRIARGRPRARCRDQIVALTAELDRVNALLLSEPQIVVAWAAADDEPDILGDTDAGHQRRDAAARAGLRHPGSSRTRRRRWSARSTRCAPTAKASPCR